MTMLLFFLSLSLILTCGILYEKLLGTFLPLRHGIFFRLLRILILSIAPALPIYTADPNLLYLMPFFFGILWICVQGSPPARLTLLLNLYIISVSLSGLITQLAPRLSVYASPPPVHTLLHILQTVILLIFWLLFRYTKICANALPILSPPLWRVSLLMSLFTCSVLLLCIAFPMLQPNWEQSAALQSAFSRFFDLQTLLMTPLILMSVYINLYIIRLLSLHEQLLQANTLYEVNRTHYEQLEQSQLAVRRLRHDMANHLQTMRELDEAALRTYIDALIDTPAMQSYTIYCENQIVNAVLQNKMTQIEQQKITAQCTIALPKQLPIQPVDLCALFANSLDNAIEACMRLPVSERRISLQTRAEKGLFVLRMCNPTIDQTPFQANTLPPSSKADRKNHGYGLPSLQEIAMRYGGTFHIARNQGIFELLITIPLPQIP